MAIVQKEMTRKFYDQIFVIVLFNVFIVDYVVDRSGALSHFRVGLRQLIFVDLQRIELLALHLRRSGRLDRSTRADVVLIVPLER